MKYHCFTLETKTKIEWNYTINDHPTKGYFNRELGLYFHLIPKNASSFLAGNAANLNWEKVENVSDVDFKKGLIVIRDPIFRWISGIFEFFYIYNMIDDNFENNWKIYKKLLIHNPIQDGHTSPQEEFLINLDLDKFKFVFMSETNSISDKVQLWLSNNGYANNLHKFGKENEALKKESKVFAYSIVKETVCNDTRFKDKLKEHFKTSYNLIDWVGKNNKWI